MSPTLRDAILPCAPNHPSLLTSSDTARDFLANERTFLSWLRLSLLLLLLCFSLLLRLPSLSTPPTPPSFSTHLFSPLVLLLSLLSLAVGASEYALAFRRLASHTAPFYHLPTINPQPFLLYPALLVVAASIAAVTILLLLTPRF